MKTLKITKKNYKTVENPIEVHDIEVKDEHHYFLKNGILSHNSVGSFIPQDVMSGGGGPLYNASIINFLHKSQLKDEAPKGEDAGEMKATGIIVRSAPKKNRFARPITVRFHISFFKGMNPYVGLEEYISWKNCGIEKGQLFDEKGYQKWAPEDKQKAIDNNWGFEFEGKKLYFYPKATSRTFVCRHLGKTITPGELFTSTTFTDVVLHELDDKVIKPKFMLPDVGDINDTEEFIDNIIDSDEDDTNPFETNE
jgi:hypothetical protein